ncbi:MULTISPECIES: YbjQ family protein [Photobacterium]|uniref:YbjQ family protein n=1 Tax=Photobacterium TaxID=657 RepID=UPI002E17C723|nr:YbjQ family protein [Photobacterium sp. S4TG1]
MIFSTTETVPGHEIVAILGLVTGNIVQSKHIGRDIMAGLKTIIGGELKGYTEMFNEARSQAMTRLEEDAVALGADAVVGVRFTTSAIMDGSCELLAFGTAVTLQPRQ